MQQDDELVTHGIRANGKQLFTLTLRGKEVYELLQILERRAVQETSYLEVRTAVYFAERIRDQVKEQGF